MNFVRRVLYRKHSAYSIPVDKFQCHIRSMGKFIFFLPMKSIFFGSKFEANTGLTFVGNIGHEQIHKNLRVLINAIRGGKWKSIPRDSMRIR